MHRLGYFIAVLLIACTAATAIAADDYPTLAIGKVAPDFDLPGVDDQQHQLSDFADAKALLVMLFFMHLLWEANWKYVLTIPASIMSVFLLLMLFPDIKMRTKHYAEERWLYAATPATATDHAEHDYETHQD